jgi:hypothetical protein
VAFNVIHVRNASGELRKEEVAELKAVSFDDCHGK